MSVRPGDFTQRTKDILAKRAGQICSSPNCNKRTSSGHTTADKAVVVGEAAHIYGEAPKSARYDPSMTDEQRKDILNGIWLCSVCHKMVDTDELRYTAKLLLKWKEEAESKDFHGGEHKLDVIKPLLDVSITGVVGSSKGHFVTFTVKNIGQAVAFDLECMIKGFGYLWIPEKFGQNNITLEPQGKYDVVYEITRFSTTPDIPPEKILEMTFSVLYKNENGELFELSKEIIQTPSKSNMMNELSFGGFNPPKIVYRNDRVHFVEMLPSIGGGKRGLFKVVGDKHKSVIFGISNTLLGTWGFWGNSTNTETAVRELGLIVITKMLNDGNIRENTMLTSFDLGEDEGVAIGFEGYKKYRESQK